MIAIDIDIGLDVDIDEVCVVLCSLDISDFTFSETNLCNGDEGRVCIYHVECQCVAYAWMSDRAYYTRITSLCAVLTYVGV